MAGRERDLSIALDSSSCIPELDVLMSHEGPSWQIFTIHFQSSLKAHHCFLVLTLQRDERRDGRRRGGNLERIVVPDDATGLWAEFIDLVRGQ
jgi:hypothetical protein